MNNNYFKDDEKIEQLLFNAPKITDSRSKDEVFHRLKEEGLFDEAPNHKKNKNNINWLPFIISVAAVLLCIILIPSIINSVKNENNYASDSEDKTSSESSEVVSDKEDLENINSGKSFRTAVYPEDLDGNLYFSIGLVSEVADSVPISLLIPQDQILQDIGTSDPTGLQLYNEYAPRIDEKALGFIDYHPFEGTFSEKYDNLTHYLPNSQQYDIGSASFNTYQGALIHTFSKYYNEISFRDENGVHFVFNEVGDVIDSLNFKGNQTQYNYFRFTQSDGSQFLVPNFRTSYDSVEEALNAMKVETNNIYESVILDDIDFSCKVNGDTVVVKFNSKLSLAKFNQVRAMQMIEGILLTAASFNKQVQFENITTKNWQGFDFTKPLPIPIGPNKLSLTYIQ